MIVSAPKPTPPPSPPVMNVPSDVLARAVLSPKLDFWDPHSELVSSNRRGVMADKIAETPSLSADGRYVAFASKAGNLVEGWPKDRQGIFVKDRLSGQVKAVSVASDGSFANDVCYDPSISADGNRVVFTSRADNLPNGDKTYLRVYLHDCKTGQTICVSKPSAATGVGAQSQQGVISPDGNRVGFRSQASSGWDQHADIFVYDVSSGRTVQANLPTKGEPLRYFARDVALSQDGHTVAFTAADSTATRQHFTGVYVRDLDSGQTTCVSRPADGRPPTFEAHGPSLSADGNRVAFFSATDLLGDCKENPSGFRIYVHDRDSGNTVCANLNYDGKEADGSAYFPTLSADGHYVSFVSDSRQLAGFGNNEIGQRQTYVHDLQTHQTAWLGTPLGDVRKQLYMHDHPVMSADGRLVAYDSRDGNSCVRVSRNLLTPDNQRQAALEMERQMQEEAAAQPPPPTVVLAPDHVIINGVKVPRHRQ